MSLLPKSKKGIILACLGIDFILLAILALVIALVYMVEGSRGKSAWARATSQVEAKGGTVDWNKLIPSPVPDDQNFFKAPKMSDWFVKNAPGAYSNYLYRAFNFNNFSNAYPGSNSMVVAEVTFLRPVAPLDQPGVSNIVLRYSAIGSAFFVTTNQGNTNGLTPAGQNIPLIDFEDVPLTTAIESMARQGGINYILDPEIGYGLPDKTGHLKAEPVCTLRWSNINIRQALLALLHQYGLQLIDDPKTDIARITRESLKAPDVFIPAEDLSELAGLLKQNAGQQLPGISGPLLLVQPLDRIKPLKITCFSEKPPSQMALSGLMAQALFPGANPNTCIVQTQWAGTNILQLSVSAARAADYLQWSDQFTPDFNRIREALKRPYFRMDGDYTDPTLQPVQNFVAFRTLSQTLAQRAQCHLLLGEPGKALEDLSLLNDSRRILESAPSGKPMTLVAAMINVAVASLFADAIADGEELGAWREPQLAALQSQLHEINLMPDVVEALKTEQASFPRMAELYIFHNPKNKKYLYWPRGWVYQNLAAAVQMDQKFIDGIDVQNNQVLPSQFSSTENEFRNMQAHYTPYTIVAVIAVPNFSAAARTFAFDQTRLNEAQIACALERYHLAHGVYPNSLDLLSPQYITQIPHDLIGGKPLQYHPNNDGSFTLYSIGWNEKDDGSEAALPGDKENGDWVWMKSKL